MPPGGIRTHNLSRRAALDRAATGTGRHKWNYNIKIKFKYDVCEGDLSNSEIQSVAALINIVIDWKKIPKVREINWQIQQLPASQDGTVYG